MSPLVGNESSSGRVRRQTGVNIRIINQCVNKDSSWVLSTDLAIHAFQLHSHQTFTWEALHGRVHPRRPQPRTAGDLPGKMCAYQLPRATVRVEAQNPCEALEVIMDEGVI